MPKYVYRCKNDHRIEVIHSIHEDPDICCGVCGCEMSRVPQAFTWYRDPSNTLLDKMDDGYRKYRKKKERLKKWQQKQNSKQR